MMTMIQTMKKFGSSSSKLFASATGGRKFFHNEMLKCSPDLKINNGKFYNTRWYPTWYERDVDNFRGIDLFSRLLKDRIIFLDAPIDSASASIIISQLLLLESENSSETINLYINSPGGEIHAGMAIYDTMQYIRAPIATLCVGHACSMASLLLAAGEKGHRKALPHSFIMVHQPSSGTQGQASDIEIHAKHVLYLKNMLNELYQKHTNAELNKIEQALDRDTWMTATEAAEWGLIDLVVEKSDNKSPDVSS